jgi:hypothetical protein
LATLSDAAGGVLSCQASKRGGILTGLFSKRRPGQ